MIQSCCSKTICKGCSHAHCLHQLQQRQARVCPFCRHTIPKSKEEVDKNNLKRIEANDPVALREIGTERYHEGNYEESFEYLAKAVELGDIAAQYYLGHMYQKGEGVEKDEKKGLYHLEEAAIGGHPEARYSLGSREWKNDLIERSMKHYIIGANLGHVMALKVLKESYKWRDVTKADFAGALRGHQAAVDARKSPQREAAAIFQATQAGNARHWRLLEHQTMSTIHTAVVEATDIMCCASCGVAEVDEIKLKKCTACKSVRYCSVKCQRNDRPKHKKACKKRAAEIRDKILFRQPESSHLGIARSVFTSFNGLQ
ncbi:hypothetical protein QTG54_014411 [Skeletonema marinoi]|uniref:MYND-type domain-containing protein n=1 Tax=Skeletonema marinoi TaxID=267567 RepID=A0AAD9D5M3_9STRA|nr:hypothetical protein QTG54_014411 [Skeletonema marinoi]